MLHLQSFDFDVVYANRKDNIDDPLSGLINTQASRVEAKAGQEKHDYVVAIQATPNALTIHDLK